MEEWKGIVTDHLEIEVPGNTGLFLESHGEVETHKIESCTDDEVRYFSNGLGTDEGKPMICFGLSIRAFINELPLAKILHYHIPSFL